MVLQLDRPLQISVSSVNYTFGKTLGCCERHGSLAKEQRCPDVKLQPWSDGDVNY